MPTTLSGNRRKGYRKNSIVSQNYLSPSQSTSQLAGTDFQPLLLELPSAEAFGPSEGLREALNVLRNSTHLNVVSVFSVGKQNFPAHPLCSLHPLRTHRPSPPSRLPDGLELPAHGIPTHTLAGANAQRSGLLHGMTALFHRLQHLRAERVLHA